MVEPERLAVVVGVNATMASVRRSVPPPRLVGRQGNLPLCPVIELDICFCDQFTDARCGGSSL